MTCRRIITIHPITTKIKVQFSCNKQPSCELIDKTVTLILSACKGGGHMHSHTSLTQCDNAFVLLFGITSVSHGSGLRVSEK